MALRPGDRRTACGRRRHHFRSAGRRRCRERAGAVRAFGRGNGPRLARPALSAWRCVQGRGLRDGGRGGVPVSVAAGRRAGLPRGAAAAGGKLRALGRGRACGRGERARCRRCARGCRARLTDIREGRREALMSGLPEVRIGIVGYGMMGKAHSYGYREAPRMRDLPVRPRLRLISGRRRELLEKAAASYGVEDVTTDWRRVVEGKDIDLVDICTPPGTHAEIAAAAAAEGKAVV